MADIDENGSEGSGPPHLPAYLGLLRGLITDLESKEKGADAIKTLLEKFEAMDMPTALDYVQYARVAKSWDKKTMKVFVLLSDPSDLRIVQDALVDAGATKKYGRPPPGKMERLLAKALGEKESDE